MSIGIAVLHRRDLVGQASTGCDATTRVVVLSYALQARFSMESVAAEGQARASMTAAEFPTRGLRPEKTSRTLTSSAERATG